MEVEFAPGFSGDAFYTEDPTVYTGNSGKIDAFWDTGIAYEKYNNNEGEWIGLWYISTMNINGVDYEIACVYGD